MVHVLSKDIVCYCFTQNEKLFGLFITATKGWFIISFNTLITIVNKFEFYFLSVKYKYYLGVCISILLGFKKSYHQYIILKGIGYKFLRDDNKIFLRFGYSHRIVYISYINIYCNIINKNILSLESRSIWELKKVNFFFTQLRKKNVYKKKGLFVKGFLHSIKNSGKKSKF